MNKVWFLSLLLLLPLLKVMAQPINDSKDNAVVLSNLNNYKSADGAFSIEGATPDGWGAPCTNGNITKNVWFKFQATTNEIDIKVITGGTKGTLQYSLLALFDSNGTSLGCYSGNYLNRAFLQRTSLTPGNWYYFSVDISASNVFGTFSLEVTNQIGFDLRAKALLLSDISNYKSADAEFSNAEATPDGTGSTCSDNGNTRRNVWFKFQAVTTEVEVKLLTGASKGTAQYTVVALFDSNGSELSCNKTNGYYRSVIQYTSLTIGNWYYFSVDNHSGENMHGTFSLEVTNQIGFDLRAKALLLSNTSNYKSADAEFSNAEATPDGTGSTCSDNGNTRRNVWFKFQAATTEVEIKLLTGASKGTGQYTVVALFDANGSELSCNKMNGYYRSVIQYTSLTIGNWYYFSVDNHSGDNMHGTFSLEVTNQIGFDLRAKALLLSDISNYKSADAEFSNAEATPDGTGSTCSDNGNTRRNVWFKFQAATTEVEIKLLTGASKGTGQYTVVALFDANGSELSCNKMNGYYRSVIQYTSLTIGNWYYFSVDNHSGESMHGTFSLEVTNQIGFDLRAKALLLSNTNNYKSADAEFSNAEATPDGTGSTCADGGNAKRNVWFKFQATTTQVDIKLRTGAGKGTTQYALLALFDSNGSQLSCNKTDGYYSPMIQYSSLIIGGWYYFSVDNHSGEYMHGTFSLEVANQIGFDLKAGAIQLAHGPPWCSSDALYSNVDATADEINNSTCAASFNQNVWFKFVATSTKVILKLSTGNSNGTLSSPSIYLMDKNAHVIQCATSSGFATAQLEYTTLTLGNDYYVIVDSAPANAGAFTLCIEGGAEASGLCESLFCNTNGVGISTPIVPTGYRLAVNGKIIAEGVKVELKSKWPDYVFANDYTLKPLSEVKTYVEENGHLQGIPSAAIAEREGIDLGEINVSLLRKIEELTLYLIKQEEKLQTLNEEIQLLKVKGREDKN